MGTDSQSDMRLENAPEQRISSEKADLDRNLILDRHGFPLLPQPTSHKDDPLVSLDQAAQAASTCKLTEFVVELEPTAEDICRPASQLARVSRSYELGRRQPCLCAARKGIRQHHNTSIV
jgi:hypothetical protein